MKRILMLAAIVVLILGCSEFTVKTDYGFLGPAVYELTNGDLSIKYYNGNCCCIAKDVLGEIKLRIETGRLDWTKLKDKQYADEYLQSVCDSLLNLQEHN